MYRDDLASEAERAEQLQRAIVALEAKLGKLKGNYELIEREGRHGRYGYLMSWWGVALVIVSLGLGFLLGNQGSMRGPEETRCRR